MLTQTLSIILLVLGIAGTAGLAIYACFVFWSYQGARPWDYRWRWRDWRLSRITGLASLFFLAMTASYSVLGQAWAWLYLILAVKTISWWLVRFVNRRS